MTHTKNSRLVHLQDGRQLGYAEYGPYEGTPVFYFHGYPGSRLDWRLIHDAKTLTALNARIIAPDRPGFGLSDNQRGRKILDWRFDVIELADSLQLDRFAVLGVSGGGPYAAACAAAIGDRLIKAGIVCGMGPADAPGMKDGASWTIPGTPSALRGLILKLMAIGLVRDPAKFLSRSKATMSEIDGQLLDQPGSAAFFLDGLREAFRRGVRGAKHEAALYSQPWGFRVQDIAHEVHLWHGAQDLNVPQRVGRALAETIPNCMAKFYDMEGHLTLPHNHMTEIMGTLVA